MYKVILEKGYPEINFLFPENDIGAKKEISHFIFFVLDHYVPNADDDSDDVFSVKINRCAEGGNPETAHTENQLDDTEF